MQRCDDPTGNRLCCLVLASAGQPRLKDKVRPVQREGVSDLGKSLSCYHSSQDRMLRALAISRCLIKPKQGLGKQELIDLSCQIGDRLSGLAHCSQQQPSFLEVNPRIPLDWPSTSTFPCWISCLRARAHFQVSSCAHGLSYRYCPRYLPAHLDPCLWVSYGDGCDAI